MKCQEAESEILSQLDDSSLSSELKMHLQQCSHCAALLAESTEVNSIFQNAPVLEPSPFLWTRIEGHLRSQSVPSGWSSWLPRPAAAWATVALLILLSFSFLTTFENQTSINPDQMLAQNGLTPKITNTNPFLIAQTNVVNGSNPFLEAMLPRRANPFEPQRVP